MRQVAVVGGGLTGLVAARLARSQGEVVSVLEAERRTCAVGSVRDRVPA